MRFMLVPEETVEACHLTVEDGELAIDFLDAKFQVVVVVGRRGGDQTADGGADEVGDAARAARGVEGFQRFELGFGNAEADGTGFANGGIWHEDPAATEDVRGPGRTAGSGYAHSRSISTETERCRRDTEATSRNPLLTARTTPSTPARGPRSTRIFWPAAMKG